MGASGAARRHPVPVVILSGVLELILLVAAVAALTGCAHSLGYAGKNPGAVECDGKAVISFSGSGALTVGYGGTETNAGAISFDCNKARLRQYNPMEPPTEPAPTR